ncbi:MAG TPA: Smr/MutS family protein [Nevskiaceae bacterium]|nr:Smr/MutS family protein [Nevskiaceae bacterium]
MVQRPAHPAIDADEAALFRAAVAGIERRTPLNHVSTAGARPSTRPRSREADDRAVMEELLAGPFEPDDADAPDSLRHRSPGIQDRVWRRLQRGGYHIDAELDLHGLNRQLAYQAVTHFIVGCRERDQRCVRIIHGKGLRSTGRGPILRALLGAWLRRRNDVLAFCPTRPADGGSGATYVLLRAAPLEAIR